MNQKCTTTINDKKEIKILLVDDNAMNRMVISNLMANFAKGLLIETAEDGLDALEQVKESHYDLIFMDIQMPVMGGYEASRNIRNLPGKSSKIPILVLSADLPSQTMLKENGITDFLLKPFTSSVLKSKVTELLSQHNAG